MRNHRKFAPLSHFPRYFPRYARTLMQLVVLALAAAIWTSTAHAQRRERACNDVVAAVCAACHA